MRHEFIYNGMNSRDYGLRVSGEDTWTRPQPDITRIPIPGRNGDLIQLDVKNRILAIVGTEGQMRSSEEIDAILSRRRADWKPKPAKYPRGVLRLFSELAASPMKGAYLDYDAPKP